MTTFSYFCFSVVLSLGIFAAQLIAAELNMILNNAGVLGVNCDFGAMIIGCGSYSGSSISAFLTLANNVFGAFTGTSGIAQINCGMCLFVCLFIFCWSFVDLSCFLIIYLFVLFVCLFIIYSSFYFLLSTEWNQYFF
jgi:hypothetical protein